MNFYFAVFLTAVANLTFLQTKKLKSKFHKITEIKGCIIETTDRMEMYVPVDYISKAINTCKTCDTTT